MSKDIRIKKGLDIKLVGEATLTSNKLPVKGMFALKPQDFHGIIPKLIAKEGAEVTREYRNPMKNWYKLEKFRPSGPRPPGPAYDPNRNTPSCRRTYPGTR